MNFRTTYHAEIAKRETFKQIIDSLKGRRKQVFEAILHYYPVTDKEISFITGIPINIVPARRKELQGYRWEPLGSLSGYVLYPELEYIEFDSYKTTNGRKECRWRPTDKALRTGPELNFNQKNISNKFGN